MSRLNDVTAFHKAFNQDKPQELTTEFWDLRFKLAFEEWNECCAEYHILRQEPTNKRAMTRLLDGHTDVMYIMEGTAQLVGFDQQGAWDEVQLSNMSKLDDNGQPLLNGINCELDDSRPYGKVLKSNNFKEPQLEQFIKPESES